jgi:hypothetical protein
LEQLPTFSALIFLVVILAQICHKTKEMNQSVEPANRHRFDEALRRFDEENAKDPNRVSFGGATAPRELLYAQWLTEWVLRLTPDASEVLLLAARSAHLCRWTIPRDAYPMNRAGYLRWRQELKAFHGTKVAEILNAIGYDASTVTRVRGLVSKSAFPADPESRVLEDALCLVFLEHQFGELAARSSDEKMINALQKTWKKMTPAAQEAALKLAYPPLEQELLKQALGSS